MSPIHCTFNSSGVERLKFSYECFILKFTSELQFTIEVVLFALLIFLIILVNTIVIIVTLVEKLKKPIDLCFLSNSFSDLIMGLIVLPISGVYTLFGHFPFSLNVCYIWTCIDFTIGTVSMLHITYISYERYIAVSDPIKYKHSLTSKTNIDPTNRSIIMRTPTYLILIIIWIVACVLWVPVILFFLKNKSSTEEKIDYLNYHNKTNPIIVNECGLESNPLVVVPHSIIVYYLPMILIVTFYSKTINILNNKIKMRKRKRSLFERFSILRPRSLAETRFTTNTTANNSDYSSQRKETIQTLEDSYIQTNSSLITKTILNDDLTFKKTSLRALKPIDDIKLEDKNYLTTNHENKLIRIKSNSHLDLTKTSIDDDEDSSSRLRRKSTNDLKKKSEKKLVNHKPINIVSNLTKRVFQEKKITYRVGLVMFTFVLSWTPFSILWPISSICPQCLPTNLYLFSFWLAYLNSLITPLLVLISSSSYKESISSLFKKINKNT